MGKNSSKKAQQVNGPPKGAGQTSLERNPKKRREKDRKKKDRPFKKNKRIIGQTYALHLLLWGREKSGKGGGGEDPVKTVVRMEAGEKLSARRRRSENQNDSWASPT